MSEDTRTVKFGDGTVTLVARPKNKHREQRRQIYRKLANLLPGMSIGTVDEFASLATYVVNVTGDLWKPPSPHASEEELKDSFQYWLEEGDEDFTEFILGELEKK